MDPFRQLQVLTMLTMALLFAPAVVPPLRRYAGGMRIAAVVLYLAGGLAVFATWQLGG